MVTDGLGLDHVQLDPYCARRLNGVSGDVMLWFFLLFRLHCGFHETVILVSTPPLQRHWHMVLSSRLMEATLGNSEIRPCSEG
jgi:hypothetical protein